MPYIPTEGKEKEVYVLKFNTGRKKSMEDKTYGFSVSNSTIDYISIISGNNVCVFLDKLVSYEFHKEKVKNLNLEQLLSNNI